MKRKQKTFLQLSQANGILADITTARKSGQFVRAKSWSANGDTKNTKADRRTTRQQLRNYL